jgi:hypothetical protein
MKTYRGRTAAQQRAYDKSLNAAMLRIAQHDAENPNWADRKWIVRFGQSENVYYTEHHAEQFMRALQLNGTRCEFLRPTDV